MENINNASESEQMYLVTIARLGEVVDKCPIPISKVAEILEITPISANQMIHHLEQHGLITYTPYKGVEFTEAGWHTANKILRIRRLWEVFLAEHLRYAPKEAETLSCSLEHAISVETADRLAEFLDWPKVSPLGKPIPQSDGENPQQIGIPLSSLHTGKTCTISAIHASETESAFLQEAGLCVGVQFEVLGNHQNGAYLIKNSEDDLLNLSSELAQKIQVKPEK